MAATLAMTDGCVLASFVALVACACASDPPPKPAEAPAPPLEIPPLPPPKEPPARPLTRDAPPPLPPPAADDEPVGVPSALALPCRSDAECVTHRCNQKFGKCAFPCTSDRDCIAGATCFTQGGTIATCIPKQP